MLSLLNFVANWISTLNSLTPKSVPTGTKNSRLEGFLLAKHKDTNIPTMIELQWHGFDGQAYTTPGSLRGRGWTRPSSKGFSRINKLKEKIIYFYSLSVNLGWQCQQMCLSATPLKRQTFLSVDDMSGMSVFPSPPQV